MTTQHDIGFDLKIHLSMPKSSHRLKHTSISWSYGLIRINVNHSVEISKKPCFSKRILSKLNFGENLSESRKELIYGHFSHDTVSFLDNADDLWFELGSLAWI